MYEGDPSPAEGLSSSGPGRSRGDVYTAPQAARVLGMDRAPGDPENFRELMAREDLSYRLGRTEARAELTERAESTVREERDRLIRELEEERAERRRLAERLERLEEERQGPSTEGRPEDFPSSGPIENDVGRPADPLPWWKRIFR